MKSPITYNSINAPRRYGRITGLHVHVRLVRVSKNERMRDER